METAATGKNDEYFCCFGRKKQRARKMLLKILESCGSGRFFQSIDYKFADLSVNRTHDPPAMMPMPSRPRHACRIKVYFGRDERDEGMEKTPNSEVCHRHSSCGRTDNWNVHTKHPNFISGYTGNIPTNLRWTGDHRPCETRDFMIPCKTPVNTFYVIHPEQYLPSGSLSLPKIRSQIPPPLMHAIARHTNHPHIRNGSVVCQHDHPLHETTCHRTCDPKDQPWTTSYQKSFGHVMPCGCGSSFMEYRLVPPPCGNVCLNQGKTL